MNNISKFFLNNVIKNPDKKIIGEKINNKWKWYTQNELNNKVIFCRERLLDCNINKSDRVIYKGKNSINWLAWNLATYSVGGVWIPVYHNQNKDYIDHVYKNSDSKLFINDGNDLSNFKNIKNIINNNIDESEYNNEYNITNYELSNIIYTSGTSGKPKGVILSHNNLLSNIDSIKIRFKDFDHIENMKCLNILPWAHIYSLNTELYYNLLNENQIALSTGPENFINEIREINPHTLYLVPRVLEEIKKKLDKFDIVLVRKLIPIILKKLFGENLITIFMGGAKLSTNVREFYEKNNINICEGYGCTETSPMVSVNHISSPRDVDSIGKILDNVIVEIIDGEICVSGENVMSGYWNNEEDTNKVLIKKDNKIFYKTGDGGRIENDFLFYGGRISMNYKLSNGKFVNVEEVESSIKKYTNKNLLVYGEGKAHNIIIIEDNIDDKSKFLDNINKGLPKYLKIIDVLCLEEGSFTKFLTPKMSIKRKEVYKFYQNKIDELYI